MPRYKLRTLLILLAVLPPLSWFGWGEYQWWRAEQDRQDALKRLTSPATTSVPPVFTVASGPDEVLKSLGPPPPGTRWIKTANGVTAESTDDEIIKAEQAAAYERAVKAELREGQPGTLHRP